MFVHDRYDCQVDVDAGVLNTVLRLRGPHEFVIGQEIVGSHIMKSEEGKRL